MSPARPARPAPARRGRALFGACLGLAASAALLWGASAAVWYRVTPAGRSSIALAGAAVRPSLTGLALLALAGIAALVATAGPVRRVLAGLLGVAGAAIAVVAVLDELRPVPTDLPAGSLPPGVSGAALLRAAVTATPAPLLAVAGGCVLAGVGVFVLLKEPHLARLGARYGASSTRAQAVDPDRDAWAALDEGRDPTADLEPIVHTVAGAAPDRPVDPAPGDQLTPTQTPGPAPVDPDVGRRDGAV